MIQFKPAPRLPKVSTATGTSPMASPKPSPPPTPKSATGSPKPEPPALPAEAADYPYAQSFAFQGTTTDVDNNLTEGTSSEVIGTCRCVFGGACPEDCQEGAAHGKCSSPRERVDLSLRLNRLKRPSGSPKWYFFSPGTGRAQGVHHQVH